MPDDATIIEGDAGFIGMASRLNPVQLQPGMCQLVQNMRLDRGVAQTRKGAKRVGDDISLPGDYLMIAETGPTLTLGVNKTLTSLVRTGATATATLAAHGYKADDLINVTGAVPEAYNGDFFISNVSANAFDFTLPQDPGSAASGTIVVNKGPIIKQTYEGGIFAAGLYSSPLVDNANEYIVLAGPNAAYLWSKNALITKSYPSTDTILSGDDVSVLQAFDKLYILRDRAAVKNRVLSISQTGGTLNALRDVWNFSTTSMLAVGDNGTVLNYNGKLWTAQNSGTSQNLNSVWAADSTNAWAVGAGGVITKYNGATWELQSADITNDLIAVWGITASQVWAVGANGTVLNYNGTSWSPLPISTTETLRGIWGTAANNFYVCGDNGVIFRWNGTAFVQQPGNATESLNGIWGTSATNIYAVGASGRILRYTAPKTATGVAATDVLTSTAHGYTNGQRVAFQSLTGGAGLNTTSIYFVQTVDANTFRLTASLGGPVVDFTTDISAATLATWSVLANAATDTLNAIWGSDATNILAAGNGGRILRSTDGATWTTVASGLSDNIYGVRGSSVANAAVVGGKGAIALSTNNTTWTAVVRGIATATTAAAHGYNVNDAVRISGVVDPATLPAGVTTAEAYNGEFIIRSVPSTTTFTYSVPGTTYATANGQVFCQGVQPALVWDGNANTNFVRVNIGTDVELGKLSFIGMPCTAVATYFNNQVVVARGRDEVLLSDIFDGETYDAVLKTFRANAGSNDYIVAIHPFAEQQLLVFCRNSIYIATAVTGADGTLDVANSSLTLLTNEIGCVSRRSVVTAGQSVLFLSDRGVYRLDAQFDLKLRGNTKPLSDAISDQLDTLNVNYAFKAAAVYFDNRFYLAVPLMGDDQRITLARKNTATNTVTATAKNHTFKAGEFITIRGAVQNDYNGTFAISNVTRDSFDFVVKNFPATPATGTILANRGAQSNNTVFIYNMLNEAWESADTYDFAIDGFVVATYGNEKRLFANSKNGRLFLLDESEDAYDDTQTGVGSYSNVEAALLTRQYNWQLPYQKRIGKFAASILTGTDHDSIAVDAITTDPDMDAEIYSLDATTQETEDFSIKAPVRRKAHYAQFRYRSAKGRATLRQISVEAFVSNISQLTRTVK